MALIRPNLKFVTETYNPNPYPVGSPLKFELAVAQRIKFTNYLIAMLRLNGIRVTKLGKNSFRVQWSPDDCMSAVSDLIDKTLCIMQAWSGSGYTTYKILSVTRDISRLTIYKVCSMLPQVGWQANNETNLSGIRRGKFNPNHRNKILAKLKPFKCCAKDNNVVRFVHKGLFISVYSDTVHLD